MNQGGLALPLTTAAIIERLERTPLTAWHVKVRLVVGVATFFNAFDMLAIAYALPVLAPAWNLTPGMSGLLISALFVGEIVGAVIFGFVAERYGRRTALVCCTALYSIMSIAAAVAPTYGWLVAARLMVGLGLGAEVPIAVTYISEIAKAHGRGRFILFYEMIFPLGLVLAGASGWWLVVHVGWRPLMALGGVPALIVLPMQRFLPESPRWLAARGRLQEADAIVTRIEATAGSPVDAVWSPRPPTAVSEQRVSWRDILGPQYWRRSLVLWLMYFSCFFMNFGLVTWLPTLYRSLYHLSLSDSLRNTLITQSVGLAGTFASAMFIDVVGRRVWFGLAFLLSALAFGALGLAEVGMAQAMLAGSCIAFFFVSAISIGMILYAPELYPTRARALGVSLGYATSVLAGVVAPLAVGAVVARFGLAPVFALFAAFGVLAGLVTLLFATETRRRVLEEISP